MRFQPSRRHRWCGRERREQRMVRKCTSRNRRNNGANALRQSHLQTLSGHETAIRTQKDAQSAELILPNGGQRSRILECVRVRFGAYETYRKLIGAGRDEEAGG